jgi:hypothetical protein
MKNKNTAKLFQIPLLALMVPLAHAGAPTSQAPSPAAVQVSGSQIGTDKEGMPLNETRLELAMGAKRYACNSYISSEIPLDEKTVVLGKLFSIDYFYGMHTYKLKRSQGKIDIVTDDITKTNILSLEDARLGDHDYEIHANCSELQTFESAGVQLSMLNLGAGKYLTSFRFKHPDGKHAVSCSGTASYIHFLNIARLDAGEVNMNEELYTPQKLVGMRAKLSGGYLQIVNYDRYAIMAGYDSNLLSFPDLDYLVHCEIL